MRKHHREASFSAALATGQTHTGEVDIGSTFTRQPQLIHLFLLEMVLPSPDSLNYITSHHTQGYGGKAWMGVMRGGGVGVWGGRQSSFNPLLFADEMCRAAAGVARFETQTDETAEAERRR